MLGIPEVFATLPATIVGTTRIVGGDLVAFAFVVDAGSYDPDTSPASYAKDLAGEVGSAVISLTPATVADSGGVVVSLSFKLDADAYDPDASPVLMASALATETSVEVTLTSTRTRTPT